MNLNDLALVRTIPYKLQNHLVLPEDDHEAILAILETLSGECRKRHIAMTGGATSIHHGMEGLDVSVTVSGFIPHPAPNRFQASDVLIGLPSSGLHANGFTRVRELFKGEARPEFVTPTRIYADAVLPVLERYAIHGMMHITGGAYTKLKDCLEGADLRIRRDAQTPQPIFHEIYGRGVSDEEMYRTFNCGIGFVLGVDEKDADRVAAALSGVILGEVTPGTGKIAIESAFSEKMVRF